MLVINKIGFLLHMADIGFHYQNIWEYLEVDKFDIIIYTDSPEEPGDKENILNFFGDKYNCVNYHDIVNQEYVYKYLVSHQFISYVNGNENEGPIIKRLGLINIRMMYALGKSKWNYDEWNSYYDMILCYGPYQADHLKRFDNIKLAIGYPRYDKYFNGSIDKNNLLLNLGCDINKKTIVWLPTYSSLSSIDLYAENIARFSNKYNVIVKPHPGVILLEPERKALLEKLPFTNFIKENYDNLFLFKVADYVFCDYGGTCFGALYLDKNFLFLNLPDAKNNPNLGNDSAEIEIRDKIVNLDFEDVGLIEQKLDDADLWNSQKKTREELRNVFFAPYYGFSSKMVSVILKNFDEVFQYKLDELKNENYYYAINEVEELINCGNYEEAEKILLHFKAKYPDDVNILIDLSVVEINLQNFDFASDLLDLALSIDPGNINAFENRMILKNILSGK